MIIFSVLKVLRFVVYIKLNNLLIKCQFYFIINKNEN